jgi:hypothetical protein
LGGIWLAGIVIFLSTYAEFKAISETLITMISLVASILAIYEYITRRK